MIRERIGVLSKQTDFLLKKQEELLAESDSVFDSLTSFINENLKGSTSLSEQDLADLKTVYEYIVDHRKKSDEQLKGDIEFLKEQVTAINQIKATDDDAKVEELLNVMIDKDEKLQEMELFEKQVSDDIDACKKELQDMFDDIKESIKEGKVKELRLLLEVIKDESKQEQLKEEESCCGSGCKDCDIDSCK